MTLREVINIELSDLKSISVTCKQCGLKITIPVKDLAKMDQLQCGVCKTLQGRAMNDFYLGSFARELVRLQEHEKVEFEITHE